MLWRCQWFQWCIAVGYEAEGPARAYEHLQRRKDLRCCKCLNSTVSGLEIALKPSLTVLTCLNVDLICLKILGGPMWTLLQVIRRWHRGAWGGCSAAGPWRDDFQVLPLGSIATEQWGSGGISGMYSLGFGQSVVCATGTEGFWGTVMWYNSYIYVNIFIDI